MKRLSSGALYLLFGCVVACGTGQGDQPVLRYSLAAPSGTPAATGAPGSTTVGALTGADSATGSAPAGAPDVPTSPALQGTAGAPAPAPQPVAPATEPVAVSALLSETGLYADMGTRTLASGVMSFSPRFELFSDGATKQRYISLPAGTQIDTTDMDDWRYPVGTKSWKEFARDGVLLETRLLVKTDSGWHAMAYLWRPDGTDADAVPEGVVDAYGTPHDVPKASACNRCHAGRPDQLLGFSAIQLAHAGQGATLSGLAAEGRLSTAAPTELPVPGDAVAQAALGGLHVNCGPCHNPASERTYDRTQGLDLRLTVDGLASVEDTPAYLTMVHEPLATPYEPYVNRVVPGQPEASAILDRMQQVRGSPSAMPPLGVEELDDQLLDTLRTWVNGL